MYDWANGYRKDFLANHGKYEHLLASVERPGIRIEMYHRDDGVNIRSVVVVVDDKDRDRLPFDCESRVEGYIGSKAAIFWFSEYCKRYGMSGKDVDDAVASLWACE